MIDDMRYLLIITTLFVFSYAVPAQKPDTIAITKQELALKYLQPGRSSYLVYFKRSADGPAEKLTLVNINVEAANIDGRKAYSITQQWDSEDAVIHTSKTLHDAEDFSTLRHDIWWKARGFTAKFDFLTKQASFEGTIDDATKSKIVNDFEGSFSSYNLCWHSDLTVFQLFPYKAGRTFRVNFYDPGAAAPKIADYVVAGSETLVTGGGQKIDCWIMEYTSRSPKGATFVQRFWIAKRTQEVLKEEDIYAGGFRYKVKLGI
jgi:hypothetical protein